MRDGGRRKAEEENPPFPFPVPLSVAPPSGVPLPHSSSILSYPSHSSFSSLFSLDTPLGSFLFSYGASAVLVGFLLLAFSLMNAHHTDIKNFAETGLSPSQGVKHERVPKPKIVMVGQITGMVECKWADDRFAPAHNRIALGSKYALASGLMKITYLTGAKVLLQGPCTYEVESTAGGYLSLGKLTARVDSRSRLPGGTSPSALPPPS